METRKPFSSAETREKENTKWHIILLLWGAGILAAMQFAKFSITYDSLINHYTSGPGAMGVALSIVGIVGLFLGSTAGVLVGRIGFKKVLVGSLLLGGILSILQAQTPPLTLLVFSRALEGLSHLGIVVAAPILIVMNSGRSHQAIAMGLWGTFFGVGYAVAGWLGLQFIERFGFQSIYVIHGLAMFTLATVFMLLLKAKRAEAKGFSLRLFITNLPQDLRQVYSNPRTCFPAIIFLFHALIFVALLTFLPKLAGDQQMTDWLTVVLPLVSMAGTFIAGFISQYLLSPKTLAKLSFIGISLCMLLIHIYADSFKVLPILCIGTMLCSGLVQGAAFALIPLMTKNEFEQSNSIGAIAQLGNLGATVGSPLIAMAFAQFMTLGMAIVVIVICGFGVVSAYLAKKY